jgi:hypothetical protein
MAKKPSSRDLAEIRSGTASARDRAEAGMAHKATPRKHAKKMSNTPKRKRGKKG